MFKKMIAWFFACVFVVGACPIRGVTESTESLLKNGSFADGSVWSVPQNGKIQNGYLTLSGTTNQDAVQFISVVGGQTYTLSARYRAPGGGAGMKIQWWDYSGASPLIADETFVPAMISPSWKTFSSAYTAPANATHAYILLRKINVTTDVSFDDVAFTHIQGVVNGDFSSLLGWTLQDGAKIENGVLTLSGTKNMDIVQLVTNVVGGETYTFSAKYRAPAGHAAWNISYFIRKGTKLEPSGDLLYEYVGEMGTQSPAMTGNSYQTITREITIPKHVEGVMLILRTVRIMEPVEDVSWDDVSFTGPYQETPLETVPFVMKNDAGLRTDKVFYYTDETECIAEVADGFSADSVSFTLSADGKTPQSWQKRYGEPLRISLGALSEETMYTLSCKVKKGTTVIATGERQFYRVKRPLAISKEGKYHKITFTGDTPQRASEPEKPIFLYDVPVAAFETAAKAGITVVQGQPSVLDAAAKAGLSVICVLYNGSMPAGHPNNAKHTKYVVEKYKNHPAVFAWAIMDEPYYQLVTREAGPKLERELVDTWLANSYRIIHEIDKNHPVYVMQDGSFREWDASLYADISGIDPYIWGGKEKYSFVFDSVKEAVKISRGKPVYALLQTCKQTDDNKIPAYFPADDVLRHMVYAARLAGAEGIGYYKYSNVLNHPKNDPNAVALNQSKLWDVICEIGSSEEKAFIFSLPRGKPMGESGIYAEAEGKSVLLYHSDQTQKTPYMLEATYADGPTKELTDVQFLPMDTEKRMAVYSAAENVKRFIWTDGQGFLAPGV